jgi:Mg2+ and Co2+ transporter CorA
VTAIVVQGGRVKPLANSAEFSSCVAGGALVWLDLVGEGKNATTYLTELGLDSADTAWALRFGQAGRLNIGLKRLRAVTWIADHDGALLEIHFIASAKGFATVWSGDPAILDAIRLQFADRLAAIEGNIYEAAGILLQLLLGTLDVFLQHLDERMEALRLGLNQNLSSADFAATMKTIQKLQTTAASFSRYASAVRSATVGVETVPGAGARGADELNDFADQVDDFEGQLVERRRWMSDLTHDFATAVAHRQAEQINRLTLVSLIFLPVTALTGFFGMNFDWMTRVIASPQAFFAFGVALPLLSVALTTAWLSREGLMRLLIRFGLHG